MSAFIELDNVSKTFGGGVFNRSSMVVAVDNVSLSIHEDQPSITTVAGESGSGKTTLARLLLGSHVPTEGKMLYRGKDFTKLTSKERLRFRREVQPIFQDPFESYNPFYKVDHVLEAPINNFKLASSKSASKKLIEESLEMVGLVPEETLGRFPHQLSGGQRQRIMVARALLLKPRVILADEPVSMLDVSVRGEILELMSTIQKKKNISFIYITHDLATAKYFANKIIILYAGEIMESGQTRDILTNPKHPYTKALIDAISIPDPKNIYKEKTIGWQTDT